MAENWYQNAVFYELYIRAFADGNGDGHGDFRGAIEKLDYVKSLGVDCIWILPMYPSPLKDDGYDVADYNDIHPDYGTLADFKAFLDAAHERGLRVVTDMVMNHTSDQHPWFQEARREPNSPYHNYYVWSETGEEYAGARIIFLDTEASNWSYDEAAGKYFWHRFYSSQPDLNYDNPAVHQEMFKAIRFWLDMGIDGFRADAVPYLYEREGTNCENLPETHAFLKKVRQLIDEEYPGRVLIAEANQWPEDLLPYFGEGDEFHMCFHFPIMPRLYMALKQHDKTPILNILARTPPIPAGAQWLTFLRNHDELTLEMVTPEERQWMWAQYAPEPRMRLNLGIRRRLAPLLDNDKRRWLLMNALLLSLPGTPIIYYGDEIGMGDNIWLPDRHGCRTPMQWSAGQNAGFSPAGETYLPANDDPIYGYQVANVAAQEQDPNSYLWATRYLLQARRQCPELQHGRLEFLDIDNPAVLAYWRVSGEQRLLALYNLSEQQQSISLDLSTYQGRAMTDLLTSSSQELLTNWPVVKILTPYASHWLRF
ncbi:MAG: maltose alpha-D-glucosyltransferase [Chloroflexi bacterium]|nr:maltose alpha-D-glucosyltransferase [Chloroflexota bacterium]MCI0643587.1 maltose alpha-D-glucosyltransferase [Chloroflexota bacterium]MCI0726209.1 maltose alpha-D-glucosyltransferase [Chloroflexota bacterium]